MYWGRYLVAVVLWTAVAEASNTAVRVTGRWLEVNGQATVPRGLLGLHADATLTTERARDWGVDGFRQIHYIPGSSSVAIGKDGQLREPFQSMEVVIDCQGDRYVPATVLTNPDFAAHFRRLGYEYADRCRQLGWKGYAEFWNEPYLNWAERSRKNYDPKFYDVTKATDDGPVTIKGWDKPLRYLRWRRLWAQDEKGKINHLVPVPKDAKPGDKFNYALNLYFTAKGERSYTVVEKWDVYDPTQVAFWSGKQNYDFYEWMFLPWAKAIKETNATVQVLGGWDFPIYSGRWQAWELLYKPLIDAAAPWLDGITEHHYGSDTRANAGTYEVVVGYALTAHHRRLRCFNTETAGCVDPAVPGNVHGQATPYGAFNYGLRDIVELCYRCPDKAGARIAHGSLTPGWGGGGDEFLFKFLKDFRGRLVETASPDLDLWPIAAVHSNQLVVVLYNDHATVQTVMLDVAAPVGAGKQTWVEPIEDIGPLQFVETNFTGHVTIPPRTGVKVSFPLAGPLPGPTTHRHQYFARGVLQPVKRDRPVKFQVALPARELAGASQAGIKVVLEGVRAGQGTVVVNGTVLPVPAHPWITEIPVEVKSLRETNELVFATAGADYQVDIVSVVLDVVGP